MTIYASMEQYLASELIEPFSKIRRFLGGVSKIYTI